MHPHEPLLPLPPDDPVILPLPTSKSVKWYSPDNSPSPQTLESPRSPDNVVPTRPLPRGLPGGWIATTLPDGTVCLTRTQWWRKGYPYLTNLFSVVFIVAVLICFALATSSSQDFLSGHFDHYFPILQWGVFCLMISPVIGFIALLFLREEIRLAPNRLEVHRQFGGKVWSDGIYGPGRLTIQTRSSYYNPQLRKWTRILSAEDSLRKIKLMYNTHFNSVLSSFTGEGSFDGDEADLMEKYISCITGWSVSHSQPASFIL